MGEALCISFIIYSLQKALSTKCDYLHFTVRVLTFKEAQSLASSHISKLVEVNRAWTQVRLESVCVSCATFFLHNLSVRWTGQVLKFTSFLGSLVCEHLGSPIDRLGVFFTLVRWFRSCSLSDMTWHSKYYLPSQNLVFHSTFKSSCTVRFYQVRHTCILVFCNQHVYYECLFYATF